MDTMKHLPLVLLLATSSCGTLVRVVDESGRPVQGAAVALIYPSSNGAPSRTAADGYARLADSWVHLPLLHVAPRWVSVSAGDASAQYDYPPPSELVLRR